MNQALLGVGIALGVGLAVALVAWALVKSAGKWSRIDVPDARRLHAQPTPRGGGLGMPFAITLGAAGFVASLAPERTDWLLALGLYALPNGLLGVVDDYRPLRSRVKFGIQMGLAALFVAMGPRIESIALPGLGSVGLGVLAAPFTALFLAWSTNVFNFMDGMDGLASGSGALFFATLAALAFGVAPGSVVAWVAVFGAAACLGFAWLNWPPAKIFMGDGGALYVGALLGVLSVLLSAEPSAPVPFVATVLACGSFVWDATYTLLYRIVRREDWLHPHKRHLFQRLVTAGWRQSRVRRLYALLALVGSASALAVAFASPLVGLLALVLAMAFFVAIAVAAERAER